jgi:hypothetical protein
MNKLTNVPNIPNRIKQPSICCTYCGKGYKSRNSVAFEKHVTLCELLKKSSSFSFNKDSLIEDDDIPSNRKMYLLLLELGNKYKKLEEKMEEINKYVIKKKKKIDIIEWLNTNIIPQYNFEELSDKIIMKDDIIEFLLNNSFNDTFNELFSNNIFTSNEREKELIVPLFASTQKINTLYIYDKIEKSEQNKKEYEWQELSREKLIRFLNIIQKKISKVFFEWKKRNKDELKENENLNHLSDKALVKIMTPEFKEEKTYTKFKNMIYNKIKTDMKTFVEYELEL